MISTAAFLCSIAGTLLFAIAYVAVGHGEFATTQNKLLGSGLGIAMGGLCIGLVTLAKAAPTDVHGEQQREPHHSAPSDAREAETLLARGAAQLGLRDQPLLRRSLLTALGLLPLPFVLGLRDLGPRPRSALQINGWRKDDLLIDETSKQPLRVGDLDIGAMTTVLPPGVSNPDLPVAAESAVVVIRLPPGVNRPLPGREDWAVDDLVAYSKICTHAGCPVGLYEQQTHNLLCPCHQSTFFVPDGCAVLFGPAARSLPQLPIYADENGYLRAQDSFDQPLGPSFWERG
ncbi:MAG TPA: Rieske (2Fe-2S) protein [Mycobacteriales bacterium]|jgi:ubiquinol-cytochrome c reductase iron-sulfur subunit|nr:Rieske (2Fe-2S) protein [Mycobacteriales bacterium]